jgi:hypothetical protein
MAGSAAKLVNQQPSKPRRVPPNVTILRAALGVADQGFFG